MNPSRWNEQALHEFVRQRLSGFRFIVVSNREPYVHTRIGSGVECAQPISGLATALGPILRASGGIWVAHGSGNADWDVVDERRHVRVPPQAPAYTLRRVWIPSSIEQGYYCGLANEELWPLCHVAFHRPKFSEGDWRCYREANEIFAGAVLEEAGSGPAFVFVQDYHFGLLPGMLHRRNPDLVIAHFWHIPWPNRETFRAFPWKEELLEGMLGNDLLGFHLPGHCVNFLETVDRNIQARVDNKRSSILRNGHTTAVCAFPIGIDFRRHSCTASLPGIQLEKNRWGALLRCAPAILGIGIDRIDYTKGILERLCAIDKLLEREPRYRGKLVFIQVGVPSRTAIADYRDLDSAVERSVREINARWAAGGWEPVIFVHQHVDQEPLMALHQMADFCIVSSLDDGMNLVAKEFVASRVDEDGVLILSEFAGSARQLTDALLVNPFAPDEIASAIHAAIEMPSTERRRRMRRMRGAVAAHNIFRWGGEILQTLDAVISAKHKSEIARVCSAPGAA